ncbi:hypothetical protein SAMN05192568_1004277 [Methylobacterium pseudosasicola]|uniref:Uncharacterized protein n=1 Tax=Methylobacterium pseudosasicola TaxID=582667 RepID=A0A1I4HJ13_9HYPH|nr:hypothetical protein SAMN05192568_1004277 [Methylobacterium pseudosasicola]
MAVVWIKVHCAVGLFGISLQHDRKGSLTLTFTTNKNPTSNSRHCPVGRSGCRSPDIRDSTIASSKVIALEICVTPYARYVFQTIKLYAAAIVFLGKEYLFFPQKIEHRRIVASCYKLSIMRIGFWVRKPAKNFTEEFGMKIAIKLVHERKAARHKNSMY